MHTALDIARYIINKCIDLGRPVSNLQLQKILYYVQGEYMKKNDGEPLFSDEIEAERKAKIKVIIIIVVILLLIVIGVVTFLFLKQKGIIK